jgi:hypothetical protein
VDKDKYRIYAGDGHAYVHRGKLTDLRDCIEEVLVQIEEREANEPGADDGWGEAHSVDGGVAWHVQGGPVEGVSDLHCVRRVELVGSGDVVDSGRRRKTKSGRSATVWVMRAAMRGLT